MLACGLLCFLNDSILLVWMYSCFMNKASAASYMRRERVTMCLLIYCIGNMNVN